MTANLNIALAKAQAAFGPIVKAKTASAGSYSYTYADLAAHLDVVLPVLAENELAVSQPLDLAGERQVMRTLLLHSSGEQLESVVVVGEMDDDPQAWGKRLSYARRYALAALLGVAAEDDDAQPKPQRKRKAKAPAKPEFLADAAARPEQIQQIAKLMADCDFPTERELILDYTTAIIGRRVETSQELTGGEADKLIKDLKERLERVGS